jgi:hypothetical protein
MRKRWVLLAAGVAVLGVGLVVACGDDDADDASDSGLQAGSAADRLARDDGPTGERGSAASPASRGGPPAPAAPRARPRPNARGIIYNSTIEISVDDVPNAFAEAARLARAYGGYVEKSSLSQRKDSAGNERTYASITVRIPVLGYSDALNEYRTLTGGTVQREESKSTEVTEQYVDLESRQRNLERAEQQYLELLKTAKTTQEVLAIQDRIDNTRNQIEQAKGRLKVLDQLTDLASISLNIAPVAAATPAPSDGSRGPAEVFVDAWETSLDGIRVAGQVAAVLGVIAIWLTIPGIVVYLITRRVRSHRSNTPPPAPPTPAAEPGV